MFRFRSLITPLVAFTALVTSSSLSAKIKIACVGDSITYGASIKNRKTHSYPAQLAAQLGDEYEVKNFGSNGATMLDNGDKPYLKTPQFKASLKFNPDIVIIKLGTNDSKDINWKHKDNFAPSASKLIAQYQNLTSEKNLSPSGNKQPRIILCKPTVVIGKGNFNITEKVTRNAVSKQIEQVAFTHELELVDLNLPLCDKPSLLPDKVHPNAQGAGIIAKHLHRYLTVARNNKPNNAIPGKTSDSHFHSYQLILSEDGDQKIALPRIPAQGNPWVWRARFWGHQPQFDIQMLELGYHIAYCDVTDLFGAPSAVRRWNSFYQQSQDMGLHPKPILEGMSRGGLIIHNWALANPNKVTAIIGDNCVMDFKSWPAGFGTSKGQEKAWLECKKAYGFSSDDEAKAYRNNPINKIQELKATNIPILYLIGTADKIVPPAENSSLAVEQLKTHLLLEVIKKPKLGHHPHSLPDPAAVVDFLETIERQKPSKKDKGHMHDIFSELLSFWAINGELPGSLEQLADDEKSKKILKALPGREL